MISWSRVFTVGVVGVLVVVGAGRPADARAQERPRPSSEETMERRPSTSADRHAARREALDRQRRGEAGIVRPRGGISVGAVAGTASRPARSVEASTFGAIPEWTAPEAMMGLGGWWGAWSDGWRGDRRRYGRGFGDTFGRWNRWGYPWWNHGGATCIAYIPGRAGWGGPGWGRRPRDPGVAILRGCVPSPFGGAAGFGYGTGLGYDPGYGYPWGPFGGGYPYHRFRDELRDDVSGPIPGREGWPASPVGPFFGSPIDPYLGAPVDAADCAAVTVVLVGERAYRGFVAPSIFGARDEAELRLALDAELSEGRPVILYGPYGYPVRVPPGALVDDVVIESCAAPAG
jgi:hypothetical protein